MTRREIVLLRVLAAISVMVMTLLAAYFIRGNLIQLDHDIAFYAKQYETLMERVTDNGTIPPQGSLESLRAKKAELGSRFYRPGETTIYLFSGDIQKRVSDLGMSIDQLSVDVAKNELTLSAKGDLVSILRLVHDVQSGAKSCDIRYALLQRLPGGDCQIQIRIGYVEFKI